MKSKKLKTLAVAVVLSLTVGAVPPVTGTEIPMITTTVEAAAKKVSLKAYNKKVYAGRSGKIKVKSTRGAKLSYKTSNKKIATATLRIMQLMGYQTFFSYHMILRFCNTNARQIERQTLLLTQNRINPLHKIYSPSHSFSTRLFLISFLIHPPGLYFLMQAHVHSMRALRR